MNDILHPIPNKWTSAFLAAFSKWLIDLGKISTPSNFPFVDFLKMNMSQQPIDELITQILEKGNIHPSRHLISILKTMKQKINQISVQQEKSISILSFKDSLPEALVFGPYDKNIGRLDIYCPSILHKHMSDNFWNNQQNYARCYLSQGAIIDSQSQLLQERISMQRE
jgi:hypothetical protein